MNQLEMARLLGLYEAALLIIAGENNMYGDQYRDFALRVLNKDDFLKTERVLAEMKEDG